MTRQSKRTLSAWINICLFFISLDCITLWDPAVGSMCLCVMHCKEQSKASWLGFVCLLWWCFLKQLFLGKPLMLTSLGKCIRIGTFHQLWDRLPKSGRQLHIWKILCPFMSMLMNLTINLFPVKNLPATQEPLVWSLSQEDPLEKEMASHSSILAWRILWTEEPGRPQYMGSQRVGDDSSD